MGRSWYSWWCGYLLYTDFSPESCSSCSEETGSSVACKLEYLFFNSVSCCLIQWKQLFSFISWVPLPLIYLSCTPYAYLAKCFLIFLNYQTMPFNSDLCHWHSVIAYLLDYILWSLGLLQLFLIGRQRGEKCGWCPWTSYNFIFSLQQLSLKV